MFRFSRSFTIVETIITVSLVAVLAGAGSWLLLFFVDNFLYLPSKINVDMAAADVLDIICEGDAQAGGFRFAGQVLESENNRVRFLDQNNNDIIIKVENGQALRSINDGTTFKIVPYYAEESLNIEGKDTNAFQYYDSSGIITTTAEEVRRVDIYLVASMGNFAAEVKTSVSLRLL